MAPEVLRGEEYTLSSDVYVPPAAPAFSLLHGAVVASSSGARQPRAVRAARGSHHNNNRPPLRLRLHLPPPTRARSPARLRPPRLPARTIHTRPCMT